MNAMAWLFIVVFHVTQDSLFCFSCVKCKIIDLFCLSAFSSVLFQFFRFAPNKSIPHFDSMWIQTRVMNNETKLKKATIQNHRKKFLFWRFFTIRLCNALLSLIIIVVTCTFNILNRLWAPVSPNVFILFKVKVNKLFCRTTA